MRYITLLCLLLTSWQGFAQGTVDTNLVQFSGMILDGTNENLEPIPYANVFIKNQARGTFSDFKGFFTIVAEKGDVIEFSAVGYRTIEVIVPDTLQDDRYSVVQLMSRDTFTLPELIVFPWPSREHFRLEFLAMDVSQEMQDRANANIVERVMRRQMAETPYDANENADYYLRQQAKSNYYIGQTPPMNIFNPLAWKKFFDAWKSGEYKKKKDKLK
ncbi:MAG: carboxypeptidase-like regulatory domain-containing protein [Saprospiraceae bacterium]